MTHSDTLNELAAALAAARLEFAPFVKEHVAQLHSAKGAGYSYRYGDLAALFDATTPALSKHGLAISQWPELENGRFVLVTVLLHASGQFLPRQLSVGGVRTTARTGQPNYLRSTLCGRERARRRRGGR